MSSGLKLYHGVGSPVSRACLMLIRKLELDVEVKTVNLAAGEQNTPEFLKLNPFHQVPVLVDGDFVLTESRAIMGYIVNKFKPGDSLYPSEPQARAVVDQRLYYDATVFFESAADIIRGVLREGMKKVPTEKKEKLENTLAVLDGFLSSKWFAGNNITIADYSILGTVTTVKEIGCDLTKYERLNDWYSRCEGLPGFQENLEGAQNLAKRMFALLDGKF